MVRTLATWGARLQLAIAPTGAWQDHGDGRPGRRVDRGRTHDHFSFLGWGILLLDIGPSSPRVSGRLRLLPSHVAMAK
jgi:hypothetical protein